MQWPSWLVRLVPYLGRQAETELEEEWRFHLERETDENLGRGLATSEAARQAKIRLGNRALVLEDTRAVWGWRWWDEFRQDAGLAVRMLARSPGFSLAAILTLTLGIGATTAIFSVVDSVLLTPLPYPEPERLTRIGQVSTDADRIYAMSYRDFHDLQARNRSFEQDLSPGPRSQGDAAHTRPAARSVAQSADQRPHRGDADRFRRHLARTPASSRVRRRRGTTHRPPGHAVDPGTTARHAAGIAHARAVRRDPHHRRARRHPPDTVGGISGWTGSRDPGPTGPDLCTHRPTRRTYRCAVHRTARDTRLQPQPACWTRLPAWTPRRFGRHHCARRRRPPGWPRRSGPPARRR